MGLLQVILFLMLFAVALGWVARHFKFPYPIALVIGGGLLGFVPRLPQPPAKAASGRCSPHAEIRRSRE